MTAWMIALLALLALLGSSVLAEHNDHAPPPPTWNSSILDDDVVPDDDIYPDPDVRYEQGAPTAEWIPASYQIGEEAFDLAFQASANGIIRVDMWGYYRVYYRRVTDRETFRPYFYIFNNWNTFRNEYDVDYELYTTYTGALNRDASDRAMVTCHDAAEVFATDSFPGRGFPFGCEFTQDEDTGVYNYMYKATGAQVGFDGTLALERGPGSCDDVMNRTFKCDTSSAEDHNLRKPWVWRVYLEAPRALSERWHPPPDVQLARFVTPSAVSGEGDLDVAGQVGQFTIRLRARVERVGKIFSLLRSTTDTFLSLRAVNDRERPVYIHPDSRTMFDLTVDTGAAGCTVNLVTNVLRPEPDFVDLVVTYDNGTAAVYMDGSLAAKGSMPAECGPPTMPDPKWRLGDGSLGILGDVSFLTVWSRTALAPWQIGRMAAADYSHIQPPDHHFNFDESPGATKVGNSIDNGRGSSAIVENGCEIVVLHDGGLAQLDTPLAVVGANPHVHVPWSPKLAKIFQGSFSMQMWVKPGSDVQELVELNIFGNYDVAIPKYGDCLCVCNGDDIMCQNDVNLACCQNNVTCQIDVTGSVSGKGVTEDMCLGEGPDQCSKIGAPCDGTLTSRWVYNSTYDGAVWDDPPQSTGDPPTGSQYDGDQYGGDQYGGGQYGGDQYGGDQYGSPPPGRKLLDHDQDSNQQDNTYTYVRLYLQKLANDEYAVKMEIRTGRDVPPLNLTGGTVAADHWYHFALERDVSRETLGYYINGIKRNVMDIGTEDLTNGNNTNLLSSMLDNGLGIFAAGARSGVLSADYTASFSDFMIYSDAVGSAFPAGPGLCTTPRVDNLIMWLPLDNLDASDHSTVDASGFHHRAYFRGSFVYEPSPSRVATWDYDMQKLISSPAISLKDNVKIVRDRSAAPCGPWAAEEGCDKPEPLECSSCLESMGFDTGECGLKAIGGEISFAGGYFIHTFKESGNFSVRQPGIKNLEVFAVGGGGGGGTLETSTRGVRGGAGGVARLGFFGQTVDGPSMDTYEPLGEMPKCLPETDCLTIKITIGEGGLSDAPGSNTTMEWGENDEWVAEGGAAGAAAELPDDESPDGKLASYYTIRGNAEAFSGGGAGCKYIEEDLLCGTASATGGDAQAHRCWKGACDAKSNTGGGGGALAAAMDGKLAAGRGGSGVVIVRYKYDVDWANYLLDVSPLPGTVPKVGIRDRDVTVWKSGAPLSKDRFTADDDYSLPGWAEGVVGTAFTGMRGIGFLTDKDVIVRMHRMNSSCDSYNADIEGFMRRSDLDWNASFADGTRRMEEGGTRPAPWLDDLGRIVATVKVYEKRFKVGAHSLDASTSFYQFFTPSPNVENNAEQPKPHSAESVPDGRVTGRFVKLTQLGGDSNSVAELHVFKEKYGETLSLDRDMALNKKVTIPESSWPVGRYIRIQSIKELHYREVAVYPPTNTGLNTSINLALNKSIDSSDANPGTSASSAFSTSLVDGDLSTYFQTFGGGWVEIDLGEDMPIGGIYIANLCDRARDDYEYCSLSANWEGMNSRALGVTVQIKDSAQNLVTQTASITVSSIAYLFAWHYRQFGAVINLDTHDSWEDMIDLQNLVDGDHSPAPLLADTAILDLGEETEIDGFFIVGNHDALGSKPKIIAIGGSGDIYGAAVYHSCGILNDGTLKCWGDNYYGQLGIGVTGNNFKPKLLTTVVNLGAGRTAQAVTLGPEHTCAILDDDTVKCWGGNGKGKLGYGDNSDRAAPEATAVLEFSPSPQFFVEILDVDQRQVLTTARPVTSADGYLAEFNRAGVKSIDWRYITDSDVHINSDYTWSNLLDQSYDWTGISYPPPPPPPFPDRSALKTAVDNCLTLDPTGLKCCRLGADCGVAGTFEMSEWDVSQVTDMSQLFHNKGKFNADISQWDVSSVTNMYQMFRGATAFNQDISPWDTSQVTAMNDMFREATSFNRDIRNWDTSRMHGWANMFGGAAAWHARYVECGCTNCGPVTHAACTSGASYGSSTWDNGGSLTSWVRKDDACDASSAPTSGGVGDCTDTLMSGQTCTPTCDDGYQLNGGVWSCHNRQLYRPALNDVCHGIYGLPADSISPAPNINTNVIFPEDIGDCECHCCQGAECKERTISLCTITQAQCSWQGPRLCEVEFKSDCNATTGTVLTEFNKHMPPPPPAPPPLPPPPSPPPPPPAYGYGDCGCLCNGTHVGNLDVCDENGQNCGLSATACHAVGPHRCEQKFSSTCTPQNVTVSAEFEPVPAYTGSIANYGDCECWCNNTLIGDLDVCYDHPNCGTEKTTCDTEGASRCARRCANTHPDSFGPWPFGRYIKLILESHIHLRELVVYHPTMTNNNMALSRTVTADPTTLDPANSFNLTDPQHVNDGLLSTYTHTRGGNSVDPAWFEIDLGEEKPIGGIYIANLCDGASNDPSWCSNAWNEANGMENWEYMNHRVVSGNLSVEIMDDAKNLVTQVASPTLSNRSYVIDFSEGYDIGNSWQGLDVQDNTWQHSSGTAQASDRWDAWQQSKFVVQNTFSVKTLFVPEDSYTGPGNSGASSGPSMYGDCQCFCDNQFNQSAGFIEVCDQNGGPCGISSDQCYQYGPQECANKLGQACSTYYPNWVSNSGYTGSSIDYSTSPSPDSSGQTAPLGD